MTETTATATLELPPVANSDVPAAWAPADQRTLIQEILVEMLANGWSRPMISAITEFSDSQVWRAKSGKAHTGEVDRWNAFLQGVKDGVFKPAERARKANAKQMLDNARRAAALLAQANELNRASDIKKIVADALALLPAPEADDADANQVPAQGDPQD